MLLVPNPIGQPFYVRTRTSSLLSEDPEEKCEAFQVAGDNTPPSWRGGISAVQGDGPYRFNQAVARLPSKCTSASTDPHEWSTPIVPRAVGAGLSCAFFLRSIRDYRGKNLLQPATS